MALPNAEQLSMLNCILDMVAGYKKIALIGQRVCLDELSYEDAFEEILTACEEVNERLYFYQNMGIKHGTEK